MLAPSYRAFHSARVPIHCRTRVLRLQCLLELSLPKERNTCNWSITTASRKRVKSALESCTASGARTSSAWTSFAGSSAASVGTSTGRSRPDTRADRRRLAVRVPGFPGTRRGRLSRRHVETSWDRSRDQGAAQRASFPGACGAWLQAVGRRRTGLPRPETCGRHSPYSALLARTDPGPRALVLVGHAADSRSRKRERPDLVSDQKGPRQVAGWHSPHARRRGVASQQSKRRA